MRYILQIFLVLTDKLQKKLSFLLSKKITHLMNEDGPVIDLFAAKV